MRQRALRLQDSTVGKNDNSLTIGELEAACHNWIYDCEFRRHSKDTLAFRRSLVEKLLWFLNRKEFTLCGTSELRQLLSYVANGHSDPEGRWGNRHLTKPVTARTVKDYHCHLRSLFNYMVTQEIIPASPMVKIAPPIVRSQQIQPLTPEQVTALLQAAKESDWPRRDIALIALLMDCGLRASEICGLKWQDIDLKARRCTVMGKGRKVRSVYFGLQSAKYLYKHQRAERGQPEDSVFSTKHGTLAGGSLTRSGLLQLIKNWARKRK